MGAVDVADQMLVAYPMECKRKNQTCFETYHTKYNYILTVLLSTKLATEQKTVHYLCFITVLLLFLCHEWEHNVKKRRRQILDFRGIIENR